VTNELYEKGFIVSFNVPRNKAASEFMELSKGYGMTAEFCQYEKCPRYYLARRESPRITSFDAFKHFMRYSGYKRDTYGIYQGYPDHLNAISPRGDTDDDLTKRSSHGGINCKAVIASEAMTRMRIYGINSPSYEQLPPMNWSVYPLNTLKHDGLVEVWNFDWIEVVNKGHDYCRSFGKEKCKTVNFCGWCGHSKKCIPGGKDGPFRGEVCKGGWSALGSKNYLWMWITFPILGVGIIIGIVFVTVVYRRLKRNTEISNEKILNSVDQGS
jgi:hypothetical protein